MFNKKLIIPVFLMLSLVLVSFAYAVETKQELVIYNWGDYLDPELVKNFEDTHKSK